MTRRALIWTLPIGLLGTLFAQRAFRQHPAIEYRSFALPADWSEKGEWAFARLMYPPAPTARFSRRFAGNDWTLGLSSWTQDYPRADRHFSEALRRLTRIQVRSVEQPINLDDGDDLFHWPWLYAVQVGEWSLTESQTRKLREYLLRGGFFLCEDFWGTEEWEIFERTMKRVLPEFPIVEIEPDEAILHAVYDLGSRGAVPGEWAIRMGRPFRNDGTEPHWRGIYDDRGRLLVAICFNMDVGDAWEWADAPHYPEQWASLGIRLGVNYVVYAMTH